MIKNKKQNKNEWLTSPRGDHVVQFYQSDNELIENLGNYINEGIAAAQTCIVIASAAHIAKLDKRIRGNSNTMEPLFDRPYIALDAQATLDKLLVGGLPDKTLFKNTVEKLIIKEAGQTGKSIRAYGEMVALLWKTGNKQAVLQLEELWNELATRYNFSLYCAYPELHFVMDHEVKDEISLRHNLRFSTAGS